MARSASAAAVGLLQLGKGHVLVAEARRGVLVARAILSDRDEQTLRSLGIDVTCDPEYLTTNLYYA